MSAPPPRVLLLAAAQPALDALRPAAEMLERFGVPYAESLLPQAFNDDVRAVVVASADGDLPSAAAGRTRAPVIRVPVAESGEPRADLLTGPNAWGAGDFATVAIGDAGARNAALLVVSILALDDARLREAWRAFRQEQTDAVLRLPPPALP